MSDVKRYPAKMFTLETPCVHASDYDAAQSELAALRENRELWKGRTTNLTHTNADLQQRLTAAEQRHAELVELLHKARRSVDPSCAGKALRIEIDAALKPTESGASE